MKVYTYPLGRGRRIIVPASIKHQGYKGERVYELAREDWRLLQWHEPVRGHWGLRASDIYWWDEVRHLFEGSESGA